MMEVSFLNIPKEVLIFSQLERSKFFSQAFQTLVREAFYSVLEPITRSFHLPC